MTMRSFVSRQRLQASVRVNALRLAVNPLWVSGADLIRERMRERSHASAFVTWHLARRRDDHSQVGDATFSAFSRPLTDTADRVSSSVSHWFSKYAIDGCTARDRALTERTGRNERDVVALGMVNDENQSATSKPFFEPPIITGQLESWASRVFEKSLGNGLIANDALSMDGGASPQTLTSQTLTSEATLASLLTANEDVVGSTTSQLTASITRAVFEGQSYVSAGYFNEDYVTGTTKAPSVTDSAAFKMQSYVSGNYFANDYVVGTQQTL